MPKYFDIHSHLDAPQYEGDREQVIERMKDALTHTITIGTDLESSKRAVALANAHEEVYASIGILSVDNLEDWNEEEFERLVVDPKVVAIGECGLDFTRKSKEDDYERQVKIFRTQIEFAMKHDKALMIHSRGTYPEVLEILEEYLPAQAGRGEKLRGNIHFFAGDLSVARRFFDLGFTISFTGVITFARDYDEVIRQAPLDKIMVETDAPWVAPVPYRGKRNEPAYIREIYNKIAEIRIEDPELVRRALVNNALSMLPY